MDYKEYKEIVRRYPKPNEAKLDRFIRRVSRDHSWYKHLPRERKELFIFYLDPNARRKLIKVEEKGFFKKIQYFTFEPSKASELNLDWQYYTTNYTANFIPNNVGSIRDSRPFIGLNVINESGIAEPLPKEVIEMGTFMMSCYLHQCFFEDITEWRGDNTVSQKHQEIISELKVRLNSILDNIYND